MLDRLKGVFESFEFHDVQYVVIGGIAEVLHGVPRSTFDLDVLIRATPENAGKLLAALRRAGFGTTSLTSEDDVLRNEITIFADRVRIDVQTRTPGLDFETAWRNRVEMSFRGQKFNLVSKPDLIASKKAAGREIDLQDVRALESPGDESP